MTHLSMINAHESVSKFEDYDEDENGARIMKPNANSAFGAFSMPREPELAQDSGQRMDTYNDDENCAIRYIVYMCPVWLRLITQVTEL